MKYIKRKTSFKPQAPKTALVSGVLYTAKKPVITQKELTLGEPESKFSSRAIKRRLALLWHKVSEKLFPRKYSVAEIQGVRALKKGQIKSAVSSTYADSGFYGKVIAFSLSMIVVAGLLTSGMLEAPTYKITINDNGYEVAAETKETTVGAFLQKNGIVLNEGDVLELSLEEKLTSGMEIVIKRALPITIVKGKETFDVLMLAGTVGEALERAGITLNEKDEVYPALTTYISTRTTIDVVEVTTQTITEDETLYFKEITKSNSSLPKGQAKTVSEGQNGLQRNTIEVTYKNGEEISRTVLATEILTPVVDQVIHVGTKVEAPKSSAGGNASSNANSNSGIVTEVPNVATDDSGKRTTVPSTSEIHAAGSLYEHKQAAEPASSIIAKTVVIDQITAYSDASVGTSTGARARLGTIAADPKRFPYGTKVYVPGYGYGRIEDTGGFRNAAHTQFDLFMPNESDCKAWGRKRNVKVYILAE